MVAMETNKLGIETIEYRRYNIIYMLFGYKVGFIFNGGETEG